MACIPDPVMNIVLEELNSVPVNVTLTVEPCTPAEGVSPVNVGPVWLKTGVRDSSNWKTAIAISRFMLLSGQDCVGKKTNGFYQ